MSSKIVKEVVRGKALFCSFFLLYVPIIWWAVLTRNSIAIKATWGLTLLLGIIIVIVGMATSMEAWQSPSWPRIRAKLIKVGVKEEYATGGHRVYAPLVIYQFKVDRHHYTGSNYDFSDTAGGRNTAERKIESLKQLVDEEGYINVFYNPQDPELNVINPGVQKIHGIRLGFGLILMIVSGLTLFEVIQW